MEDLFPDTSVASAHIAKLDAARAIVSAQPDIPITPQARLVVEYFKERLVPNFYYSCNTVTWNRLTAPVEAVSTLTLSDIHVCMSFWEYDMETGDPDLVFFNIVDARPERKHQVKTKHLAQKSSTLVVSSFEGVFVGDGTSVQMIHRGGTAVIDILGVCYPEALREIMMCLHRWQPSDGKRMLTFLPKERFAELSRPALLPPRLQEDLGDDQLDLWTIHELNLWTVTDGGGPMPVDESAITTAEELLGLRAFAENERFVSVLEIDTVGLPALLDLGVVSERIDEFGDRQIALNLDCIRMSGTSECCQPLQDLSIEPRPVPYEQMSKLEIMHHLRQCHWDFVDAAPTDLLLPGQRIYALSNLKRAASYWVCLAHSPTVFGKAGDLLGISHQMPDHYYKCLLYLPDLTPLMSLDNLYQQPDSRFKTLLGLQATERVLAIGDVDAEPAIPLEDGEAGMGVVPVPLENKEPSVSLQMEGYPEVTVLFTGSTGVYRGVIECPLHEDRCRLYRTVSVFPSKAHCCAYLMAWRLQGDRFLPHERARHISEGKPTPEFVESVYRKLM